MSAANDTEPRDRSLDLVTPTRRSNSAIRSVDTWWRGQTSWRRPSHRGNRQLRHDSTDHADVVITPDVRGYGLTDTKRATEIVQRGYIAGLAAIEQITAPRA